MMLSPGKTVEQAEREINGYIWALAPADEKYALTMRYFFFKIVTHPGMLRTFKGLKDTIPPQYRTTEEETRRHIVGATLLFAENHAGMRVFERRPPGDAREFRIATDFDIKFDLQKGGIYAPRGTEKGPFIPYNDVYDWMNLSVM